MTNIFKRFVAFYIDTIVISIISLSFVFVIKVDNDFVEELMQIIAKFTMLKYQLIVYLVYFTFCEFFFKSTLGKSLFKFKVQGKSDKINLLQVSVRSLSRIVPINQISFLFNDEKIFWHEKWSNVYTVKRSKP